MKIMYNPVNQSFTMYNWGVRESLLHGHVSMIALMKFEICILDHSFTIIARTF